MAIDDKIEELIREIAVKNGIAVSRDDPIMILQTINTKLMQESASAQQEILGSFKSELESIANRWGNDAKEKAERTLNAALAASREAMSKAMLDGAKSAAVMVRHEISEAVTQLASTLRDAKRVAYMNLVAAGMAVVAAGVALLSTVR